MTIALDLWYVWCPYKNMKTYPSKYSIDFGDSKWRHDNKHCKHNQKNKQEIVHRNFLSFLSLSNDSPLYISHSGFKKEMLPDCKKWSLFLNASFVEMKTILLDCKQNLCSLGFLIIFLFVKIKRVSMYSSETMKDMWKQRCRCESELYNLNAVNH